MPDDETYSVDLTAEEVTHIGRRRWERTERTSAIFARAIMIFTIVYAAFVLVARIQWLIPGIMVPFVALAYLAIKDNKKAVRAAREFLDDVKADNKEASD